MKSIFSIVLVSIFLLVSCGENSMNESSSNGRDTDPNTVSQIKTAVSASWAALGQTFKLLGKKGKTLKTDKGSRVHIPDNAFVIEETGEPAEGEVIVEFIEYSTKGEIIASEIPMVYSNPNGEKEQFESAGMFEISAKQGDKELILAEGKEIEVELATDVDGNFNFYQLDDDRKDWELKDTDCYPVKNKYKTEQEEELRAVESAQPPAPKKPVSYKKGDKLFDVKIYNYYEVDLARLNGILWKYTGNDPKENPALKKAFGENYKLVYLEPTEDDILEYNLHFESKNDTMDVKAVPVFQGKLLDKENERVAEMLADLQESLALQKKLRDQLKREKNLLRVFKVNELAVYNCDIQYLDPRAIPFMASFKLEDGGTLDEYTHMYLLPTEKRVVMYFDHTGYKNFRINPREKNRMVAVTADNTIYYISDKEIRNMRLARREKGTNVEFILKKYKENVNKAEELDELIVSL